MWTFQAMNTEVTVSAPALGDPAERTLAVDVAALFEQAERRFSRFREDSELTQLNRATDAITVSPEMLEVLVQARSHVDHTDGVFDPAIGAALIAAGYDRSFAPGALDRAAATTAAPRARFSDLAIDVQHRQVRRPPHLQIDLGGLVKGRTVDRAASLAPSLAMIDAGGDVALRGAGPDDAGWLVDVEDPADARRVLMTLRVRGRCVATSAPNRRSWRTGSGSAHHLIDPRTGRPADSDLAQVTMIAPTTEEAEVLAKVAFVLGAAAATHVLAQRADVGAVLVLRDGLLRVVGDVEVADA